MSKNREELVLALKLSFKTRHWLERENTEWDRTGRTDTSITINTYLVELYSKFAFKKS